MGFWQEQPPLTRGRLLSVFGTLLSTLDTPVLKLLRFRMPETDPLLGLTIAIYRFSAGSVVSACFSLFTEGGVAGLKAQLNALGRRDCAYATFLQSIMNLAFTVSAALTSAANVLVALALAPLLTAIIGRFTRDVRLPTHTWLACASGAVAIILCFAGSVQVSGLNALGLVISLIVPLAYGFLLTLSETRGEACNVSTLMSPACACNVIIAITVLGSRRLPLAVPVDNKVLLMCMWNGGCNAIAQQIMAMGGRTCPAPEAALISLLETALGPWVVYTVAGERPTGQTIAAAVLIVLVLACHTVYDVRVRQQEASRCSTEEEELTMELVPHAQQTRSTDGDAEVQRPLD